MNNQKKEIELNVLPFDKESGLTGKILYNDFTISKSQPQDDHKKIEFISVNQDGTATIKIIITGEILTTKPMDYYSCERYGIQGLRLISISQENEEIILQHSYPEWKE